MGSRRLCGCTVSVVVVAALQDPGKDVLPFRDLFPTRIALRLIEEVQVDMILSRGARDRGAHCDGATRPLMSDINPVGILDSLKAEHRSLDERIQLLSSEPTGDQLELARLKRRKLMIKDQIQLIVDSSVPDIIA